MRPRPILHLPEPEARFAASAGDAAAFDTVADALVAGVRSVVARESHQDEGAGERSLLARAGIAG
jgi:hypothetical protein